MTKRLSKRTVNQILKDMDESGWLIPDVIEDILNTEAKAVFVYNLDGAKESKQSFTLRILCKMSGVSFKKLSSVESYGKEELWILTRAARKLATMPLFLNEDDCEPSVDQVDAVTSDGLIQLIRLSGSDCCNCND